MDKNNKLLQRLSNIEGRIGYLIAWLLGVPASVLFLIFLIRGH
ncbi:MAG: hypothetical protein AB7F59_03475 [Bdellovibrionales bacterium]